MLSIVSCSLGRAVSRCALTNAAAAASCRFAAATKLVRFQSNKSDLKYTEKHEWIRVNGSQGVVGITDYAQVIVTLLSNSSSIVILSCIS